MNEDFLEWLSKECGYQMPTEVPGNRYVCLNIRTTNTQILVGKIGDRYGWDNAW
jgi:hypothetical protein